MIIKVVRNKDKKQQYVSYINDKKIVEFGALLSPNQIEALKKPYGRTTISITAIKQLGEKTVKEELKRLVGVPVELLYRRLDGITGVLVITPQPNPYKVTQTPYTVSITNGIDVVEQFTPTPNRNATTAKSVYQTRWERQVLKDYSLRGYVFSCKEFFEEVNKDENGIESIES